MRNRLIPVLLSALVACGDNAEESAPTFTEVKGELVPSCGISACHDPGTAESNLVFSDDMSASALVDVASEDAPGETLVIAGDPDNSYLVKKLEGADDIAGDPMPPPFGGMSDEQIQMVRDWIAAGAADD